MILRWKIWRMIFLGGRIGLKERYMVLGVFGNVRILFFWRIEISCMFVIFVGNGIRIGWGLVIIIFIFIWLRRRGRRMLNVMFCFFIGKIIINSFIKNWFGFLRYKGNI